MGFSSSFSLVPPNVLHDLIPEVTKNGLSVFLGRWRPLKDTSDKNYTCKSFGLLNYGRAIVKDFSSILLTAMQGLYAFIMDKQRLSGDFYFLVKCRRPT